MEDFLRKDFINAFLRFRGIKEKILKKSEINFGEFLLLRRLENETSAVGLDDFLHISKPAVSYMINSLEKKGCIVRNISTSDRRKIDITLTDKGRRVSHDLMDYHEEIFENVEEKFGEENLKEFIRLVNLLCNIIMDEVKAGSENEDI